jgi:GST-like protein
MRLRRTPPLGPSCLLLLSPEAALIDLYTWSTPNGRKVSIMLEESGLPYSVHPVNIGAGEQHRPEFLAINPNNRIPAIVDQDGPEGRAFTLFESGAILLYLSWKTGKFLPVRATDQFEVIQWLMFQMGGVGPMFGQVHHFVRAAPEPVPYAIARYNAETRRLYGVLNGHLGNREYLGSEYSVADMATYPWVARHEWHKVDLNDFPAVKRWFDQIGTRPAVQRGMQVPKIQK